MQRLGKNVNGYFGETIDIRAVITDCVASARTHGWAVEEIHASPTVDLLALTRPAAHVANRSAAATASRRAGLRLYLSTGIHGDEPAGPLAARQLLADNLWPPNLDIWLCPCLNPAGSALHRRENAEGADLNREYLAPKAVETIAHVDWLKQQPNFDLGLCLHEDWESQGFYVYELNPDHRPSLAEPIVAAVSRVCPIDPSEVIEDRPAQNGIIRPSVDPRTRPQWPESFYLLTHKTRLTYTLEAPSDFPIATRVAALVAGVRGALEALVLAPTPS